jgi:hypothetical protein
MPEATASCPTCGATSVQSVPVKRSTVPKKLAAEYFQGAGAGASPDTLTQSVCGRCGCRWFPRTTQERQLKALSGQLGQEAMRAAQEQLEAQAAAGHAPAWLRAARKIPIRTWIIATVMTIAILLALFT